MDPARMQRERSSRIFGRGRHLAFVIYHFSFVIGVFKFEVQHKLLNWVVTEPGAVAPDLTFKICYTEFEAL